MLRVPLFTLLLVIAPLPAPAQMIPGYADNVMAYDQRELALLPPYCKYTQNFREMLSGVDPAEGARWQATLGPAFNALHHYCWGLMKANRGLLLARTKTVRDFYMNDAIVEFDYVIDRSPPDFVLLPELLARKGELQLRTGHVPSGLETIGRAVSLKPDYWLPYALTSDYYRFIGDVDQAGKWLRDGLKTSPDSAALKSRLDALERMPRPKTAN